MSHHDRHHHHGQDHHHHHDHDHDHDHPQDKDHPHHHGHEERGGKHGESRLSDRGRLIKILEHWLHHNEDHAKSYGEWAERARALGEEATGRILDEAAADAIRLNERFREALALVREAAPSR